MDRDPRPRRGSGRRRCRRTASSVARALPSAVATTDPDRARRARRHRCDRHRRSGGGQPGHPGRGCGGGAAAGFFGVTGWIETYRPSQIIRFGRVPPGREELPELRDGQLRVRLHVVPVLALLAVQRTDDADARDSKSRVRAGSAVARNPVRIQAWLPRETVIPTGRLVLRNPDDGEAERASRRSCSRSAGSGRRRSGASRRPSPGRRRRPRAAGRTDCACASTRSSAAGASSSGRSCLGRCCG